MKAEATEAGLVSGSFFLHPSSFILQPFRILLLDFPRQLPVE